MKPVSPNSDTSKNIRRASPKKAMKAKSAANKSPTVSKTQTEPKSTRGTPGENVFKKCPKNLKRLKAGPVTETGIHIKKRLEKKTGSEQKVLTMKKKERKIARKSLSNNFELSQKSKNLWEKVRRMDCTNTQKLALCQELYNLVKDRVKELLMAHDTSRVIECLLVVGSEKIRSQLYLAVKDHLPLLMKSKYAKFFVIKLLKCCSKQQKNEIIKSMYGKIMKLIRHSEAANVVECAYNEYANAQQRAWLTEEFYGPGFALFKDAEVKSLGEILAREPQRKDTILSSMKETLNSIVDKSVMQHSITHHVLLEYLIHCNSNDRMEMISTIRESVVNILHTKDGSRIGMQCIWHGTAKDRKVIIKSMKTHVAKICMEEHGHMVLFAIFDCVDDTKLVYKALIEELMKTAADLAFHPQGRKVLLYLIAPRDTKHVHPDVIKILESGNTSTTSKKDPQVRSKELIVAASDNLLNLVTNNMEKMATCPSANFLVQAVLTHCIGDKKPAYEEIAKLIANPVTVDDREKMHIIEDAAFHMLLKRLIQNDKMNSEESDTVFFSNVLLEIVPTTTLTTWINCNRGAFTLLLLLETNIPTITAKIKTLLVPLLKELLKKKFKGTELLHSKLMLAK